MIDEQEFLQEICNFCRADYEFQNEIEANYHASSYYLYTLTNKVLEGSALETTLDLSDAKFTYFSEAEAELAKLYIKVMCSDMFENKSLTTEKASKKNYIYDCILNQLRYN